MKALLICDDGKVDQVAPLCLLNDWGIEVQAFYDPDLPDREPDSVKHHEKAIDRIKLRCLHAPFGDLCPGSFDHMVREVARNRFELAYLIARQLKIPHLVIHHGYVPETSHPSSWVQRCSRFFEDFLDSKSDITVHIENMLEHDPILISDVVSAINRPNVDVCLDIGHAHCNSKTSVLKWIEVLGSRIGYVHLHDNHGEKDEHLGLGQGTLPVKEACHALQEYAPNAIWGIEAEGSGVQESLQFLESNGFLKNVRYN